jgi:hypothetical protein
MNLNAAFPMPPVTMANLETARGDFEAKIAEPAMGVRRLRADQLQQRHGNLAQLRFPSHEYQSRTGAAGTADRARPSEWNIRSIGRER